MKNQVHQAAASKPAHSILPQVHSQIVNAQVRIYALGCYVVIICCPTTSQRPVHRPAQRLICAYTYLLKRMENSYKCMALLVYQTACYKVEDDL